MGERETPQRTLLLTPADRAGNLRLRWRLLLICLPFAGGAGLLVHILAGYSLPLAILVLAALSSVVWLFVISRLSRTARLILKRRTVIGCVAGLLGTFAYDLARYCTVAVFSMSFKPFHVFSIFGEAFIGAHHSAAVCFSWVRAIT